jgi:hypothetical protein
VAIEEQLSVIKQFEFKNNVVHASCNFEAVSRLYD